MAAKANESRPAPDPSGRAPRQSGNDDKENKESAVAFLRGMNVGTAHRVSSGQLVEAFESLGFGRVRTFITSGNVLFDHDGKASDAKLATVIGDGLAQALGYPVPTTVRQPAEIRRLAEAQPFPADVVAAAKGKPQVVLLFAKPKASVRAEVLALATDDDRLAFDNQELHWLPAHGISGSKLDFARIERLVGTTTTRTANTLSRLVAKL